MHNSFKKRILKIVFYVVIPTILIAFWIITGITINPYEKFNTFIYGHNSSEYVSFPNKGFASSKSKLSGIFKANENNLGIISIQVNELIPDDNDQKIIFSLKNKNASTTYYQNSYFLVSARESNFLFFGFPRIEDSKNKEYEFTVISVNGNKTNIITLAKGNNAFKTVYVYNLKRLGKNAIYFYIIPHKLFMLFTNAEVFFSSLLYLLPLVFYTYLVTLFWGARKIASRIHSIKYLSSRGILFFIPLLFIFLNIILLEDAFLGVSLGVLSFWIVGMIRAGYTYKVSLLISLIFFLISLFFAKEKVLLDENIYANWAYYLFAFGIIQMIWQHDKI